MKIIQFDLDVTGKYVTDARWFPVSANNYVVGENKTKGRKFQYLVDALVMLSTVDVVEYYRDGALLIRRNNLTGWSTVDVSTPSLLRAQVKRPYTLIGQKPRNVVESGILKEQLLISSALIGATRSAGQVRKPARRCSDKPRGSNP